jgi:hypothetical protein
VEDMALISTVKGWGLKKLLELISYVLTKTGSPVKSSKNDAL